MHYRHADFASNRNSCLPKHESHWDPAGMLTGWTSLSRVPLLLSSFLCIMPY